MESQRWREEHLWTIEVDQFFRVNLKSIQKLFATRSSHAHKRHVTLDDIAALIEECPELEVSEDMMKVAFAHSKEIHVKEMDDIDKYTRLELSEFVEFIARIAFLLFHDDSEKLLTEKIDIVLTEMLKLVSEKVKHPPKTEDDELVSDYEDEIVQQAKKKIKEEAHEQFLIVDISKAGA